MRPRSTSPSCARSQQYTHLPCRLVGSEFELKSSRALQVFSSSVVLCKADPLRVQERLGERLMVPPEKEKVLRRELGESTDLDAIQREITAYERLLLAPPSTERSEHHGLNATVVHTTSSKQATAQILKTYGVEMNWVWEDLKKTSSPPAH